MNFNERCQLLERALRNQLNDAGVISSVTRAAREATTFRANSGISRCLFPVLFVLSSRPEWTGRQLLEIFLGELSQGYDFNEGYVRQNPPGQGTAADREEDRMEQERRFYYRANQSNFDVREAPLIAAVVGILSTRRDIAVHDVLRDLNIEQSATEGYLREILPVGPLQADTLARFASESRYLRGIEQEILDAIPALQPLWVRLLNQYVHATFGRYDHCFSWSSILRVIQPLVIFVVGMFASIHSFTHGGLQWLVLLVILFVGMWIAQVTQRPAIGRVRHARSPRGQPIDVLYWIGPGLFARYQLPWSYRVICAICGSLTAILIVVIAISAY